MQYKQLTGTGVKRQKTHRNMYSSILLETIFAMFFKYFHVLCRNCVLTNGEKYILYDNNIYILYDNNMSFVNKNNSENYTSYCLFKD